MRYLLSLLLISFSPVALAQQNVISQMQETKKSIVLIKAFIINAKDVPTSHLSKIDPKTGQLFSSNRDSIGIMQKMGAGVILDTNGVIVTNTHTVAFSNRIMVQLHDGQQIPAKVIGIAPKFDLTYLKLLNPVSNLQPIKLVDSDKISANTEIIHIGSSHLLQNTFSGGRITALAHDSDQEHYTDLFQLNLNIYSGDSGGPILSRYGHLLGVIVAKEKHKDKVSFAIPTNKIQKYYFQFRE